MIYDRREEEQKTEGERVRVKVDSSREQKLFPSKCGKRGVRVSNYVSIKTNQKVNQSPKA